MNTQLWKHIQTVKNTSPLVHSIANFVVMNNTANAVLAVGASPIMAHAHGEVDDMVTVCGATVINIGTLDEYWSASMKQAARKANELNKPWILDPVGAGATGYRDALLSELLVFKPTVIRGNASEILALAKANTTVTKGVDSTADSNEALDAARQLHEQYGSIICISGKTDFIVGNGKTIAVNNGDVLMTKVTGLGCSATAVIGAFIAVEEDKVEATVAATTLFSLCGEIAARSSAGSGSLQVNLLDTLYSINEQTFIQEAKVTTSLW